ncbi:cytochrome c1 [Methylophilaceae bacterium]|nr:cytochrome c1 [Methylophilaceae bacterium]|tara:strand:- start:1225 stop:1923 length:699 start_codon:yes stop_codon:yes gene_type:complete
MKSIIILILLFLQSSHILASEEIYLEKAPIDLSDQPSLQKGARTFINYCLNCHSAKYMRYNKLLDIGLSKKDIKDNLLFTGKKIGDPMEISMPVSESKKWFGAAPPDLSVVARSRGSDWIYSYMKGFYRDRSREIGWNNLVYANSAMPHILWELQGEQGLDEKTGKLTLMKAGKLNQKEYDAVIADLTNYITFMSEPDKLKRKKMGFYAVGFLLLLLLLTIKLKKEFWRDVK